jgi:hypothetical protein
MDLLWWGVVVGAVIVIILVSCLVYQESRPEKWCHRKDSGSQVLKITHVVELEDGSFGYITNNGFYYTEKELEENYRKIKESQRVF